MLLSQRAARHAEDLLKSSRILEAACQKATSTYPGSYSSEEWRQKVHLAYWERTEGHIAHEWQLDVAEALALGVDIMVIAATGRGKTTPFILPLLGYNLPKKKIIVIAPLPLIQKGHTNQFLKLGISTVAVNSETWNEALKKVSS